MEKTSENTYTIFRCLMGYCFCYEILVAIIKVRTLACCINN